MPTCVNIISVSKYCSEWLHAGKMGEREVGADSQEVPLSVNAEHEHCRIAWSKEKNGRKVGRGDEQRARAAPTFSAPHSSFLESDSLS